MKYALGNMLNGAGGLNPDGLSLDLQFATDKTLTARKGPTPVFTRANATATFIGSDGLIQTAIANQARFDHDPVTLVCKGLLIEEQRTNLVFPSDALTTQTRTVTAVAHTLSFYGTGTIVLSGVAVATVTGTGAYPTRTTLTFTPTAGSLILTVTGSVTQAQLEAGAFPTSYIPTTTASVVRSADVCSITGASFTSFYNQSEGTYQAAYSFVSGYSNLNNSSTLIVSSNSTFLEVTRIGTGTSSSIQRFDTVVANVLTRVSSLSSHSLTAQNKVTAAYKVSDNAMSLNGAAVVTSSPAAITSVVNRCDIGANHDGSSKFNGHLAAIRYYKKRLANAKLQTLTA